MSKKVKRYIRLYRELGSVYAVAKRTPSVSYMSVRVALIKAGVIKGKTFSDYNRAKK